MRLAVLLSLLLAPSAFGADALDEVNALRRANGLRPFQRDPMLSTSAENCAQYRAARLMENHIGAPRNMRPGRWYPVQGLGDHQFLASGHMADVHTGAGVCHGGRFDACCVYDHYRYAGASWVTGRDGRIYCSLFVR